MVMPEDMEEYSPVLGRNVQTFCDIQLRCSTWDEAELQHRAVIEELALPDDEVTEVERDTGREMGIPG